MYLCKQTKRFLCTPLLVTSMNDVFHHDECFNIWGRIIVESLSFILIQVKLLYLPGILKSFQPKPFHCVCNMCFFFKSNKRMSVHLYFLLLNVSLELLSSGIRTFTKLSVETFNNCFIEHSNLNFWFI